MSSYPTLKSCRLCGELSLPEWHACWRCGGDALVPCESPEISVGKALRLAYHIEPESVFDKTRCVGILNDIAPSLIDSVGLVALAFDCTAVYTIVRGELTEATLEQAKRKFPSYVIPESVDDIVYAFFEIARTGTRGKNQNAAHVDQSIDRNQMLSARTREEASQNQSGISTSQVKSILSALDSSEALLQLSINTVRSAFSSDLVETAFYRSNKEQCDLLLEIALRIHDSLARSLSAPSNGLKTYTSKRIRSLVDKFAAFCANPESYEALNDMHYFVSAYWTDSEREALQDWFLTQRAEAMQRELLSATSSGSKESDEEQSSLQQAGADADESQAITPILVLPAQPASSRDPYANVRRNDMCPCGSGKKYRNCHGRSQMQKSLETIPRSKPIPEPEHLEVDTQEIMERLIAIFESHNWSYMRSRAGGIECRFRTSAPEKSVGVSIDFFGKVLVSHTDLETAVPESRRTEVAELLTKVNQCQMLCIFEMDLEDGTIRARHAIDCSIAPPTDEGLYDLIVFGVRLVGKYFESLRSVIDGSIAAGTLATETTRGSDTEPDLSLSAAVDEALSELNVTSHLEPVGKSTSLEFATSRDGIEKRFGVLLCGNVLCCQRYYQLGDHLTLELQRRINAILTEINDELVFGHLEVDLTGKVTSVAALELSETVIDRLVVYRMLNVVDGLIERHIQAILSVTNPTTTSGDSPLFGAQGVVNTSHMADEVTTDPGILLQGFLPSPMSGIAGAMSDSPDPVFASLAMGNGAVIEPVAGGVYSPVDGTVTMLFDTKHAVGLTSDDGVEVLIHIGVDTVELDGRPFTTYVTAGDTVKTGDLLITANLNAIKAAGKLASTAVLILNSDDFTRIEPHTGPVSKGDNLIMLSRF